MRLHTTKLLEENTGRAFSDINCNILFKPSPTIMEIKTKTNKWDLLNLNCFCTAKETIHKMKRQPRDWETIFANDVTNKVLACKNYKQFMRLNIIKTIQLKNGQNI